MNFWNRNLQNLTPYTPGEQPVNQDIIKLNTNENPYPPSPRVLHCLREIVSKKLSLYPDPLWKELKMILSEIYHIPQDQIFCGNGSDEILSLIFRCFLNTEDHVVIPYPNYTLYETLAQSNGISYTYIQSDDQFNIAFDSLSQIKSNMIFFTNPNAPTGRYYSIDDIYNFCQNYQGLFILDEAYIDFAGESAGLNLSGIGLLSQLDNLLIVRTFSKAFSLAGIRFGYAFGSKSLIEGLHRMKDSYNLNYITQLLAKESLIDYNYMEKTALKVISNRNKLMSSLRSLGFSVIESGANFLFTSHTKYKAEDIFQRLKQKDILVRYFNQPRLDNYLRISIGSEVEVTRLIEQLKEIII